MSNSPYNDKLNEPIESSLLQRSPLMSQENLRNNISPYHERSRLNSSYLKSNNSSINILNRNILSINNSNFDNLKKVKSQSTIYQVDKNDNNYLDPVSNYSFRNNEIKENQKRNIINSLEWFNIIKNKIFSVDINTNIKKGKNISRNKFYEEKNRLIISPKKILNNNNKNDDNKVITSYQYINKNKNDNNSRYVNGYDYKLNSALSMDNIFSCKRFKKDSEELNKKRFDINDYLNKKEKIDYWKNIKLRKNKSLDTSLDENLKEKPKKLKSKYLYFQNYKNWWKIDP